MLTKVHVNQHIIRKNALDGKGRPVYTVKQGKLNRYARQVNILGPSTLVMMEEGKQLSCGARCWLETESEVELIGEASWKEIEG